MRNKILSPREWRCCCAPGLAPLLEEACLSRGPHAGDSAAALVLLRAGAGMVCAGHPGRGQPDHPDGLRAEPRGAGLPLLQLSIPLPCAPKGFRPSTRQVCVFLCPVGQCGGSWQSHGGHVPMGVAEWGPPSAEAGVPWMPEPTWVPRHSASHPGVQLPGDVRGFPLQTSSQILP